MNTHYLIGIGEHAWRVGCIGEDDSVRMESVPVESQNDPAALARAAHQQLAAMDYQGQPIMLVLPTSWCLCVRLSTDESDRGRHADSLAYRLEEHLPVSAEDMIADRVELDEGESLGVCTEYEKLRTIVDALEAEQVAVRHICPESMLLAGYAVRMQRDLDALLITGHETAGHDWLQFEQGKPSQWLWLADDDEAVGRQLADVAKGRDQTLQLATIGDDRAMRHLPAGAAKVSDKLDRVKIEPPDAEHIAMLQARSVLEEQAAPWIDFRRDRLASADQYARMARPLGMLAAVLVLLMACIIGVSQWRAASYRSLHSQLQAQQVDVFKHALPGQRVPFYVLGRLQSERRKLAGLGGADSDATVQVTSALVHLKQVLEPLPADVPFRILDLSIEPDLIRIDGQAAGHAQAEQLARALRQAGTYDVEPPKTQLLKDKGVSFLFTAKPRDTATAAAAATAASAEKAGTP